MIKNIVFDMGRVLVDYDAMKVCEHYIEEEQDRKQVCEALFVSPEWVYLDMGVITEEQALRQICRRLPKRLHQPVTDCLNNWHRYCMSPMNEMGDVVRQLKAKGYGIYLCSNASLRLLECYREVIPAVDCFDGILFSAEEKCIKPQREMYLHLFERYHLNPEECYFIDDLQTNIEGARACGMDGYCFADQEVEKLKAHLDRILNDAGRLGS